MYKLKCYLKDPIYLLKLNNLQRELMQHCLEEAAREGGLTTAKAAMAATKEGLNNANGAWHAEIVAAVW